MSLEDYVALIEQKVEQVNRYYELEFLADTLNYPSFAEVKESELYIDLFKQIDKDYQQAVELLKKYWSLIENQTSGLVNIIENTSTRCLFTAMNDFILNLKIKSLLNHENIKLRDVVIFLQTTRYFNEASKIQQFEKLYEYIYDLTIKNSKAALWIIDTTWNNMQLMYFRTKFLITLLPELSPELEYSIRIEHFRCKESIIPERCASPVPG